MIFTREFKHNFGKMMAWFLVIVILTGLLLALYPMMLDANMKSLFDSFSGQLSPSLQKILGFDKKIDYADLSEYVSFINQYMIILIAMFAMQIGANSLSRDLDDGSIQYLYSNPVSRSEIVTQKIFANILIYIIFLILLMVATFFIITIPPLAKDIIAASLLLDLGKIFLGMLITGLIFMAVGLLFSSLSKSTHFSDGTSVLFVIFIVAFLIFGKIYGGSLLGIANAIPFEAFHPIVLLKGGIDFIKAGINLIIFFVLIAISYGIYNSKDLDF
ncbi:ABC transporter permease subunit [Peptoniphilus catoniae]|uniref:ABC transporter permease subunit n=1 Tax=Peptoniphilus catoniae TaxID=1660341 RepID=UPI0010FEAC0C|nr:ABC transporter permease subunit [Peptoniphilus catoniae]